ncbi:MAG: M1 family metallopeptidase [Defluviitaleaceae bacterium]|nr:M1 family metallopeptidase [Defluviitaleaceae bacterium]
MKPIFKPLLTILLMALVLAFFVACGNDEPIDGIEQTTPSIDNIDEPPIIGDMPINHIPNYVVELRIEPINGYVSGSLHVDFVNTSQSDISRIYFNTPLNAFRENITIRPFFHGFEQRIFRNGPDFGYMEITAAMANLSPVLYSFDENILSLTLDKPLAVGASVEIGLVFEAQIPRISHRTGYNSRAMWFGNFLPVLSVLGNDGWHNYPYYPAGNPFFTKISNFQVSIATPSDFSVAATGISLITQGAENNFTTVEAHMVRDFAFAVLSSEYSVARTTSHEGINISLHWMEVPQEVQVDEILNTASRALSYFSRIIGSNPYPNLEIVETQHFMLGTQKYPGIIFVDSQRLRSGEVHSDIARDIAHQWFYNIVGTNPVQEPWMTLGLASFLALDFRLDDPARISVQIRRFHDNLSLAMENIPYTALSTDLSQFSSWTDFRNIHIVRGTIFFYALQQELGRFAFDNFLREFYQRYAFGIANASDMMEVAQEFHHSPLDDFFGSWANEYALPELPELINPPNELDEIIWELE